MAESQRPWHRLFGLSWMDLFRGLPVTVEMTRQVELRPLQAGVYEVRHYTGNLRVVVVHELPQQEQNAMLHLFSARAELLRFGAEHYRPHSLDTSSLLLQLLERYRLEGPLMPDLLDKFVQETIDELLKSLPAEELRKRLSVEERLKGLSVDDLLAALPPEAREELSRRLKDENGASVSGEST